MLDNICIVMVETAHPGNIGSAARAMKTMGLTHLRLVNPAYFPCEQASWMASGAKDVLHEAELFSSLEEAVSDCELVIGTSARGRRIPWPVMDARQCGQCAVSASTKSKKVAIVFGRESKGLSNQELQLCTGHLSIPSSDEYGVLNVAMAVQVVCYEMRMQHLQAHEGLSVQGEDQTDRHMMVDFKTRWDEPLATAGELQHFHAHLERALVKIGFLQPQHPKQIVTRLQRLFTRARLDKSEMSMLRGVLTTIESLAGKQVGSEVSDGE